MAKYKQADTKDDAPPPRKTVVPGWARKYQREQESEEKGVITPKEPKEPKEAS